jgi:hypothetical protein
VYVPFLSGEEMCSLTETTAKNWGPESDITKVIAGSLEKGLKMI